MIYRPNPKRGRTTLVLLSALILAAEIAAGFLIDRAPLKIRFPLAAKVIDSLRQMKPSRKILFFGSSRFDNAVSAEAVTQVLRESEVEDSIKVFNASIPSGDPVLMEFETDQLLAVGIRPSMVVIELLPEVLSRRNLWLHYHLGRQFRWSEVWDALPDAYLAGKLSVVISTRFNAIYTFRGEFQRWALDALKLRFESANFGDGNTRKRKRVNPSQPADVKVLQKGRRLARKNVREYEIGGLNARALNRMVERLSKLGTTIVFIAPPVSSPYRAGYSSSVNTAYLEYLRRLGESHGTYFFDYRQRLADHLFYTPYYTTTDGRYNFSRLLAREVIVPLIAVSKTGIPSPTTSMSNKTGKPGSEVRGDRHDGSRHGG